MNIVAEIIVVAFAVFLIGVAGVIFAKPAIAERFFRAFASSARTHYTEQSVRLLFGACLIVRSPTMWQSRPFGLVGWAIVVSALLLILLPWRWHRRFGEKVLPVLVRRMKLYALGLFAFGALLLYGVLAAPNAPA